MITIYSSVQRVCVLCVCTCLCVSVRSECKSVRGRLSCESGVDASTGRQCTDSSGRRDKIEETVARCFRCCALWV